MLGTTSQPRYDSPKYYDNALYFRTDRFAPKYDSETGMPFIVSANLPSGVTSLFFHPMHLDLVRAHYNGQAVKLVHLPDDLLTSYNYKPFVFDDGDDESWRLRWGRS